MLEIVLASFINSADLIRTDMLVTTKQNMIMHPYACENNPIAKQFFYSIGFENTYILTIVAVGTGAYVLHNINPVLLSLSLKTLSAIEFYFTIYNDNYAKKEFGNSQPVYAKFQVFEYTF